MKKTIKVQGMSCGHCEKAVTDALKELDGVKEVNVHLDTGNVDVTYDEEKVTNEAMEESIEEQGYDVVA